LATSAEVAAAKTELETNINKKVNNIKDGTGASSL
jgi:hypothetical protein